MVTTLADFESLAELMIESMSINDWQSCLMTDWLTDWLNEWPTDCLTDRLIGWRTDDWGTDRLASETFYWRIGRLTYRLTDYNCLRPTEAWMTDCRTDRLTDWPTDWANKSLKMAYCDLLAD